VEARSKPKYQAPALDATKITTHKIVIRATPTALDTDGVLPAGPS
jgi:hypothetical protein